MHGELAPLPQGPWYKVKEAAVIIDVSLSTAYVLIEGGVLRGYAHGNGRGTLRIAHADLADYMERAAKKARSAVA